MVQSLADMITDESVGMNVYEVLEQLGHPRDIQTGFYNYSTTNKNWLLCPFEGWVELTNRKKRRSQPPLADHKERLNAC